ncbi:MAG: alpha/beta hydrolase, partial [Defluviitaleaceae bacterium]|nr:alpha/beta hydrolase [Defluviitaleaceae bacterium]
MVVPHGKLVKVNGKNMHIRQMGKGEKTIVLLPGYGVPLPTVEFAPLMRELAKKYTVCTVELAGYGHSEGTDTPRTNENY